MQHIGQKRRQGRTRHALSGCSVWLNTFGNVSPHSVTKFTGTDQHLERVPLLIFDESGHGTGVQAEAFLSYLVTNQLSVGLGARYWALWTTSGTDVDNGAPNRATTPSVPTGLV